ncbi:unnamed protein product [Symbiodinium sp. CCMP2592]|nr:unnamed protein product [Symbiodinium sp. CCMP2592]
MGSLLVIRILLFLAAAAADCFHKDHDEELRLINVNGENFAFPLAYGSWSSAGPVARIIQIILEEELRIAVQMNQFRSSTDLLKQTLGCTDAQGNARSAQDLCEWGNQDPPLFSWAAVEVWPTTEENKRLRRLLGTGHAMGYQTFPGLYTQKHVVKDGLAGQVPLARGDCHQQLRSSISLPVISVIPR